jgi:hypothetical protein
MTDPLTGPLSSYNMELQNGYYGHVILCQALTFLALLVSHPMNWHGEAGTEDIPPAGTALRTCGPIGGRYRLCNEHVERVRIHLDASIEGD